MFKKSLSVFFLFLLSSVFNYSYAEQAIPQHHFFNNVMQQADMLFVASKASNFTVETLFPTVARTISQYDNTEHALFGFNWNNNIP